MVEARGSWSHDIFSQEAERDGWWHCVYPLLFIQFGILTHGLTPPIPGVALVSVKSQVRSECLDVPHRHAAQCT